MIQKKPEGSVMVIGGGIAGIQAALTLSSAGYGVHLIERSATLGGMMTNLHRFYPLCACCKVDPRIAACEQDPNINVMLDSIVNDISGEAGKFKVSIQTANGEDVIAPGAIILATGTEAFDPSEYDTYSYGNLPNVITSVEYEQSQKPVGPERGVLKRPSDGRTPEKIAWLQCVGSRDINLCDAPYCSSVCCMYALKEAVNTKEFDEDIETTIFYMDMRAHGKGFEEYLNSAVSRDVRLVRSRVHSINSTSEGDNLELIYADESGEVKTEIFDLAVLSVGLRPTSGSIELAEKLGVTLSEENFINEDPFEPSATNVPGVFVCGGATGPHDIGQSIIQAASSVSEVASFLAPQPFSPPKDYPELSEANEAEPTTLVAYHLCPDSDQDMGKEIEKYAKKLPGVTDVLGIKGDILSEVCEKLIKTKANRLVFASCTPLIHKNLLEEALRMVGLNPYLYETVDLRAIDNNSASDQVRDRLRIGVLRATFISPPPLKEIPVVKHGLVVGGGIAGMESALSLSEMGYPVTLVEKQKQLGGHGLHVRATWQGYDSQEYLKELISSVETNDNINVITGAEIRTNKGIAGNYTTLLKQKNKEIEVSHGITILAPGGNDIKPDEYGYKRSKKILLWSELSGKLMENPAEIEKAETATFIQCVGSREPHRTHCSNLCCTFAVRTAVDLKKKNPDMDIYILYRDLRTFGEREKLYREARQNGIVFIRYDLDHKPEVKVKRGKDTLGVTVYDPVLTRHIEFETDFISLQTAIGPNNNNELADIFKVNLDSNGFFSDSPEKLKPMDTSSNGVYMAGLATFPKDTSESISQARGAAARALEILSKESVQIGGLVAEVLSEKCAVCCTCVRTCPFNIPLIDSDKGAAYIDPGLCQGCGMCVSECPGKAIVMPTCSDQMLNEIPSLLLGKS